MLKHLFSSVFVIAQFMGVSIPEALQETEYVYIVPTVSSSVVESAAGELPIDRFGWELADKVRVEATAPVPTGELYGPSVDVATAIVIDVETGQVLWQKNPERVVPMASITKLMTALVWFDHQPPDGLQHVHTFAPEEDTPLGKELNLPHGTKLTAFDLLRSSLVGSDNDTALALAHTTGLSDADYLAAMNRKADLLSMEHTNFTDQTGLSAQNTATAHDIARLAVAAFANPVIEEPAGMIEHLQETAEQGIFSRVRTTNLLLYDDSLEIIAGKTGYTDEAGYCVVVKARVPGSEREVISVVLGSPTDEGRFSSTKTLLDWTFSHYSWK